MYRSPGSGEVTPAMVGQDPVKSTKMLEAEKQAQDQAQDQPPPPEPAPEKPGGK